MRCLLLLLLFVNLLTAAGFAQTDPANLPKPPTNQLKIYEPFFGKYNMVSDYGGLQFKGTIEVKPAIKGWYVQQIILVKSPDNSIDREFHQMVTYDTTQQKYRVWRFETLPPAPTETLLRTEGRDIILEAPVPPGKAGDEPQVFFNRYSMVSGDEMKIVTEIHSRDGKTIATIGVSHATRIK